MGRRNKLKEEAKKESAVIDIKDVKAMLREHVEKEYGGVTKFLDTEIGEKLGGQAIRTYFYDTGAVGLEVLNKLCEYFGFGTLTRETEIIKNTIYSLKK